MHIQILAKNLKEKGDLFEQFMQLILDSAGYEDFKRGTRKTGYEIDLYAKHKVTGYPIICECKAHSKPLGADDFHKFYGIYDKEHRRNDKLVGLLFSLSGFGSTTLAAHEELTEEVKSRFLLFSGDDIVSIIRKTKIVSSEDKLEDIIKSKIPYALSERYLVYAKTGIHWVQLVLTEGKITHYLILGPNGEEVTTYICAEIGSLNSKLSGLKLLDVFAMKKTLINLLDATNKTVETISKEIQECIETVSLSMENLMTQKLVVVEDHSYHLVRQLPAFVGLARQFLGGGDELTFFLSPYADLMMNTSLIDYCGQRFRLDLRSEDKEPLLRLIRVSPSALSEILFGPTEMYEATDEHLKELHNLPAAECRRIKALMCQNVIGSLLRRLIADFEKPIYKTILEKREIKGWRTRILVNLAKTREQYLSVKAEDVILLLRATGKIKVGQLLSATNYDLFINTGDVLVALGRPKDAIRDYDKAISHLAEPDKLKAAWNNKGLALAGLKKYDKAIQCYDEALKIDPLLKEAWYNKGRAYALKGEHKKAIENYSKALEIDPDYSDAQVWMKESMKSLK